MGQGKKERENVSYTGFAEKRYLCYHAFAPFQRLQQHDEMGFYDR